MSLEVFWSDEATETLDSIVLFIQYKWGERQAKAFVKHTQRILLLISEQPYMYKASINSGKASDYLFPNFDVL